MDNVTLVETLQSQLYAYDIKGFSEGFSHLLTRIESQFVQAPAQDQNTIASAIGRLYEAFQSKDYLYALEIAEYDILKVRQVHE